MKAKFVLEALSVHPSGNLVGNSEIEFEDVIDVIDQHYGENTTLTPIKLEQLLFFFLEHNISIDTCIKAIQYLFKYHPEAAKQISLGKGEFFNLIETFFKEFKMAHRRNIIPPFSQN